MMIHTPAPWWQTKIAMILIAVFTCVAFSPDAAMALPSSCTDATGGIFSGVMCTLEGTLDGITKDMFTAISDNLKGAVVGALTLFLIFFGLAFLAGLINVTAREFSVMLFKFVLVWNFAAFWDMGAGLAYNFFKTFALSGGDMVWKAVGASGSGLAGITSIDTTLTNAVQFASDSTTGNAVNGIDPMCVAQLTGLVTLLFIMQPPLLAFVFIYIYNLLKLFGTAILYYFKSLVLISFLIVFSPIFVSFALFQRTRELFETWLKHLATNALQMLIMFAFFAMIMLVDFAGFFTKLLSLFKVWNPLGVIASSFNMGFGAINLQVGFCSICDYTVTPNYEDINCKAGNDVLPPFAIPFQFDFWMWFATKIIALQVLSYILTDFLKKSPEIAQQLGGVRYGGILVGSGRNPGFMGYTNILFSSIEGGAAAFKQAQRNAYYRPGIIGAIPLLNVRNPLKAPGHALNTLKSFGVALGAAESTMGIQNANLAPYQREVDDFSKRALESKRAMQKAERILNHQQQLHKDGKVPRAALVSAQSAYNQASLNSRRWERKLQESREKLLEETQRYGSGGGVWGTVKAQAQGTEIDKDYGMMLKEYGINKDHSAVAFFTPLSPGETAMQEDLHHRNLERMQAYGQSQIDSSYAKLERSTNIPDDVRGRIERELASANDDIKSGDIDRVSQSLDNLRNISRELD